MTDIRDELYAQIKRLTDENARLRADVARLGGTPPAGDAGDQGTPEARKAVDAFIKARNEAAAAQPTPGGRAIGG